MSPPDHRSHPSLLSSIEHNLFGVPLSNLPGLLPGVMTVTLLAVISLWLGDFIGEELLGFEKSPVSPALVAIIIGLVLSAIFTLPTFLAPGFKFAVAKILRLGIILLGIRLTVFDVFRLGAYGVPIVAVCIAGALLITTQVNRLLNLPRRLGTLIAVGTSICGVSAIVATSPAIDAEEEESAYAVAVVTIFGLLATLVYPHLSYFIFAGDGTRVGLFLGTSIHDTSQVVGAAKIYMDIFSMTQALDVATVTKLVRNVFMAAVIPFMTYRCNRCIQGTDTNKPGNPSILSLLPLFILGFIGMAVMRSIGDAGINICGKALGVFDAGFWQASIASITRWANHLLVVALAGVGLNTNIRKFKGLGFKPFIAGLGAALAVGLVSYLAISLLGSLVSF